MSPITLLRNKLTHTTATIGMLQEEVIAMNALLNTIEGQQNNNTVKTDRKRKRKGLSLQEQVGLRSVLRRHIPVNSSQK